MIYRFFKDNFLIKSPLILKGAKFCWKKRTKLCMCLFFKCALAKASIVPDPYFTHLTKTYDISNKSNLLKRKRSKGDVHVTEKKPLEVISFFDDLTPEIDKRLARRVEVFEKEKTDYKKYENNEVEEFEALDKLGDRFLGHYLEKTVLNKFVVNHARRNSTFIDSLGRKKRKDEVNPDFKKEPNEMSVNENKDDVDYGHKTNWLARRTEIWLNNDMFNSTAHFSLSGLSGVNYQIRLWKTIQFDEKDDIFNNLTYQFLIENETTYALLQTAFAQDLNLNYKAVFSGSDHQLFVSYRLNF